MSQSKPAFDGSVPTNYHRYMVPLIFEFYATDLAARLANILPPNAAVLETACGTGVLTNILANTLPKTTQLTATDLNPAMLSIAQNDLSDIPNLTLQEADATQLPFPDQSFHALACQFGLMFYPDKTKGYNEAARVLKSGGAFAFNVWDTHEHNTLCQIAHNTAIQLFPDDPPAFLQTPFSYNDLNDIKTQLQNAGFGNIDMAVLPAQSTAPNPQEAAIALVAGTPLAAQLTGEGQLQSVIDAVEANIAKQFGQGPISAPMQAITIVAIKN